MSNDQPIGVFDSGVGGLTVLRAIHQELPDESTIYLGDLARCPYGTRPQEQVRDFALQIADLLAAQDIKMLVVACNTATAAAFDDLRDRYHFPVVGVIQPGVRAAVRLSEKRRIGVIATNGTVQSHAYAKAILRESANAFVIERSASWLVPLLERGSVARAGVAARLERVLADMHAEEIDVLILGCTHFPLAYDIFQEEAGYGVAVLDSATTTAHEVRRRLKDSSLEASAQPFRRILVTGRAEAFAERAEAMFQASPKIETVNLELDPVL